MKNFEKINIIVIIVLILECSPYATNVLADISVIITIYEFFLNEK